MNLWLDEVANFTYLSENSNSENLVYETISALVTNLHDTFCAS